MSPGGILGEPRGTRCLLGEKGALDGILGKKNSFLGGWGRSWDGFPRKTVAATSLGGTTWDNGRSPCSLHLIIPAYRSSRFLLSSFPTASQGSGEQLKAPPGGLRCGGGIGAIPKGFLDSLFPFPIPPKAARTTFIIPGRSQFLKLLE